jgi:phosphatidylglycerol:prolipoprotein diacylglycerol transferase
LFLPLLALPFPPIDPVLIRIGPLAIHWYAVAYIAGIFIGWWYAKRLVGEARLWGSGGPPLRPADIDDFVVWATLGIVVGGRLGYVLFYDLPRFAASPAEIFAIWQGGMSFHGGFLGTALATVLFARTRGIPVWSLIDVIAPSVTFGLLFGRLANFANGELFGRVSDLPWAVFFPDGGPQSRHPSQLYEAALEGLARTLVEFFREPDVQIGYLAGGLTMGMALSIPMIAVGVALMAWAARRRPAPAAADGT